jgi:hypothetical protein
VFFGFYSHSLEGCKQGFYSTPPFFFTDHFWALWTTSGFFTPHFWALRTTSSAKEPLLQPSTYKWNYKDQASSAGYPVKSLPFGSGLKLGPTSSSLGEPTSTLHGGRLAAHHNRNLAPYKQCAISLPLSLPHHQQSRRKAAA